MPRTTRRLSADETLEAATTSPALEAPAPEDPASATPALPLRERPFFEHLAALTEREWEDRVVYLYRGAGDVVKADATKGKFIDKITRPFDESYVKEQFGGGRYLAILKNYKTNEAERKASFEVDGVPRLQADEVLKPRASTPAPADPQTAGLEQVVNKLVDNLMAAMRTAKPGDDVISATTQQIEAVIDLAKKTLPPPSAAPSAMGELRQMMVVLKEMGLIGAPRERNPSLLDTVRELREVFGFDPIATLGGKAPAVDWRAALVGQAPGILATVRQALDVMDRHQQMNFQVAMQRVNAAQAQAPQDAAAAAPPVAVASATSLPAGFAPAMPQEPAAQAFVAPGRNADGSLDFDWIRHFLVRQFRKDGTGEFVGELLAEMFPDAVPLFTSAFGDADALLTFVKSDPVLAEIASHAQGDGFIRDFAAALAPPAAPAEPSAA